MAGSWRTLAAAGLLLLSPLTARSATKPGDADGALPNFDARRAGRSASVALPAPDVDAAVERLRTEIGREGLVRVGPGGRARAIALRARQTAQRAARSPEEAARQFLARHHRAFGLDPQDVLSLDLAGGGRRNGSLTHYAFRQRVGGLDVFGALIRAHLNGDGQLVGLSSTAAPAGSAPPRDVTLTAEDALAAALGFAGVTAASGDPADAGRRRLREDHDASERTVFESGSLAAPPETRLVLFPMPEGLRLAWHAVVALQGLPRKYDVLVDAVTGDLLYRRNRVLYTGGTGRVLQSDATRARDARLSDEHPLGAAPDATSPFACPPAQNHVGRDLAAAFRDPATVLANTGRLEGNNVHVYRGTTGIEGDLGSLQPDGTWSFDAPFNSASAAEAQLFFVGNFLHDFFYDLGFDEAAGNFQEDNFGRGGVGGDSLIVLARADGRNNATFEPKPDGQRPVMSMFLWDGTGCWAEDVDFDGIPDLDGAFDLDIVIHEFHHGVSHRLNPEFTGVEADAIGEGGSDFFAYSINGDTSLAEYSYPPTGIRQVNGKGYGSWWCLLDIICLPHDNGEIWANVLWDLRERFRADLVDGTEDAAIRAVHLLYVDGLALSPPSPTMLDMRDAMVAADVLRRPSGDPGGSVDYCRIWEVFALRGMGAAAQDTNDTASNTVVPSTHMPAECPALSPPATVTIAATDAQASEAGLDPGAFTITRSGDTTRALTLYFDTPGGVAVEGRDFMALPASVVIPAGDTAVTVPLVPIDDLLIESNESATWVLTPGPGYQLGSPASASVTIVSDDVAPDLVITAVTGTTYVAAGSTITVGDTTKNQGTDQAPASVTAYFLSTNALVEDTDLRLGERAVPALAIGATSAGSASVLVPSDLAAGIYYVLAQADASGAIGETSDANNVRALTVRVGPDLTMSSLTVPSPAAPGSTLSVTASTRNLGAGAAGASVVSFHLSVNAALDASDIPLGTMAVPPLGASATHTDTASLVIPTSVSAGTYYVIAKADSGGAVVEFAEANNTDVVQLRLGADLVITSLSAPAASGAGVTVSVGDTTKNQGGATAPPSATRLFLSGDATLDAGDTLLGERNVPPLAPGAASSGSTSVTFPLDILVGSYYLIAQADATAAIGEVLDTNNVLRVQIRIGPDLEVTSLTAPGLGGAGTALLVGSIVKNQGGAAAAASTLRFYLSGNTSLEATDTMLTTREVPGLLSGATSSATSSVVIPPDTVAGTYYLLAQADATGVVVETSETNNVDAVLVRIGADLIISAMSVSPIATAGGGTLSIADTVKNNGGAPAPATTARFVLSADTTADASDVLLGSRTVPALAAGAVHASSTTVIVPRATLAGTWYVVGVADADAVVSETAEGNNARSATVRVGPDLKVTSLSAPSSVVAGGAFTVNETGRNDGGGTAAGSVTRFYLSVNGTVDDGDAVLGSRTVQPLLAGAVSAGSTSVTVPAGFPPGRYYLLAVADADEEVAEVFENNNRAWMTVTVVGGS